MSNLAAGAVSAADPTLASFYPLVWWIIAIKVVVIFLFLLLFQILMIWAERRIIGRMQNRPGPTDGARSGCFSRSPTRSSCR